MLNEMNSRYLSGKSLRFYFLTVIFFILASYSSTNAQWEQVSNGIGNQLVNSLAISGNKMFAGTHTNGVYVSADNGATWTQTALTSNQVLCLAAAGSYIYAGTYTAGVYDFYYSSDYGTTWTQSTLYNLRVSMLAVSGSTLFAAVGWGATTSGVYYSNDNGVTWIRTSLQEWTVSVIADGTTLYAGTQTTNGDHLYRSYDLGQTWTSIYNRRIFSMYFGSGFILAGYAGNAGGGISKSTDNGATWTTVLENVHTYAIEGSGNYIFAGTGDQGAYFSTDYGVTWDNRNEGLPSGPFGLRCYKITNNYLYAGTSQGIWRNPNNYFTLFYDYGTYTGMNNWVTNQGWAFTWAVTNGAFTDSPGKSYTTKKNYSNNANNSLTLKNPLNTSGYEKLKVTFKHKYLTQAGKDFCRLEVSADNGSTWAEAKSYSGIMDTMLVDDVDITGLANNSVNLKIRFRLTSDNRITNDGWYVTDIRVIGKTAAGNITDNFITKELPNNYLLGQNYPNPFNPVTKINYYIPVPGYVTLKIYNIIGKEVAVLINEEQDKGNYQFGFDASNLPSGVYFYKLVCGTFSDTKRMVLVK